jgi:hypothetical protein
VKQLIRERKKCERQRKKAAPPLRSVTIAAAGRLRGAAAICDSREPGKAPRPGDSDIAAGDAGPLSFA